MIIEPKFDLPEEIYKDWLADQEFDHLRDVYFYSLISLYEMDIMYSDWNWLEGEAFGEGLGSINNDGDGLRISIYENYGENQIRLGFDVPGTNFIYFYSGRRGDGTT